MYITQAIPKLSSLQGKTKGKMLVVRSHNVPHEVSMSGKNTML